MTDHHSHPENNSDFYDRIVTNAIKAKNAIEELLNTKGTLVEADTFDQGLLLNLQVALEGLEQLINPPEIPQPAMYNRPMPRPFPLPYHRGMR